jgi:hypothetical protein
LVLLRLASRLAVRWCLQEARSPERADPGGEPIEDAEVQGPGVVGDDQRPVMLPAGRGSDPHRDAATRQRGEQSADAVRPAPRDVAPAAGRTAQGHRVDHDGVDGSSRRRAAGRVGVGGHDRS